MNNRAANIVQISPKEEKKYILLKEGDEFRAADYIHILDEDYAEISKCSVLLKSKVNKHNKVLRRK